MDCVSHLNLEYHLSSSKFNADLVVEVSGSELTKYWNHETRFSQPLLCPTPNSLGLRMPRSTFSVDNLRRRVGSRRLLDVLNVSSQQTVSMTVGQWHRYILSSERHQLLCMTGLEFSATKLDSLVQSPQLVRQTDWIDCVWPSCLKHQQRDSTSNMDGLMYPKVQKFCVMSVEGCFVDFRFECGGSSLWYHVLRGSTVFWLVPPSEENIAKYVRWYRGDRKSRGFLGTVVDKCHRIKVEANQTLFIPSGWIYAVYSPCDSLAFSGSFLHSFAIKDQIRIVKLEEEIGVRPSRCFPFFTEMLWYVLARYVLCALGNNHLSVSEQQLTPLPESFSRPTPAELHGLKVIVVHLHKLPLSLKSIPPLLSNPAALLADVRRMVFGSAPMKSPTPTPCDITAVHSNQRSFCSNSTAASVVKTSAGASEETEVERADESTVRFGGTDAGGSVISATGGRTVGADETSAQTPAKSPPYTSPCIKMASINSSSDGSSSTVSVPSTKLVYGTSASRLPPTGNADPSRLPPTGNCDPPRLPQTGNNVPSRLPPTGNYNSPGLPQTGNCDPSLLPPTSGSAVGSVCSTGCNLIEKLNRLACGRCIGCVPDQRNNCSRCRDSQNEAFSPATGKCSCLHTACLRPELPPASVCCFCGLDGWWIPPSPSVAKRPRSSLPSELYQCDICLRTAHMTCCVNQSESNSEGCVRTNLSNYWTCACCVSGQSLHREPKQSHEESIDRLSCDQHTPTNKPRPSPLKPRPHDSIVETAESNRPVKRDSSQCSDGVSAATDEDRVCQAPMTVKKDTVESPADLTTKDGGTESSSGVESERFIAAVLARARRPLNMPLFVVRPAEPVADPGPHRPQLEREVLVAVFEFLSHCELLVCQQVCRAWAGAGLDRRLWPKIVAPPSRPLTSHHLRFIVRRQPVALLLDWTHVSGHQLLWLLRRLPHTERLQLAGVPFDVYERALVDVVGGHALRLRALSLAHSDGLCDARLRHLLSPARQFRLRCLLELSVADSAVTDAGCRLLVDRLPLLRVLDVSGCGRITDTGIGLLATLQRLQRLHLSGCRVSEQALLLLRPCCCLETVWAYSVAGIAGDAALRLKLHFRVLV